MDLGIRGPFLELFRRGDTPREVRLLAARGGLAPPADEQLALLLILADDPDVEVAVAATETMDGIPEAALAGYLARADVPEALRAYFAERGVHPANTARADEGPLVDLEIPLPDVPEAEPDSAGAPKMLSQLPVIDRIKLAMKGTREQRNVLVRDANKLVASAVISSPKLSESEIESFARMTNVSEEVLRLIGNNRSWVKSYVVASALAKNPKTPLAISVRLVPRMNDRDIKGLARDRNVPEGVRQAARRIATRAQGR